VRGYRHYGRLFLPLTERYMRQCERPFTPLHLSVSMQRRRDVIKRTAMRTRGEDGDSEEVKQRYRRILHQAERRKEQDDSDEISMFSSSS